MPLLKIAQCTYDFPTNALEKELWDLLLKRLGRPLKNSDGLLLQQWMASRLALMEGLRALNLPLPPLDQLAATRLASPYFEKLPWLVSLSHSAQFGAALLGPRHQLRGLGVDIELSNRQLTSRAAQYILHPLDPISVSPLFLWCAKEAAYKTLSGAGLTSNGHRPIAFRQLQYCGDHIKFEEHKLEIPLVIKEEDWVGQKLCLAWCTLPLHI